MIVNYLTFKEASKSVLPRYDFRLLFPTLFLVGIGIVMVYSASSLVAMQKFGSDTFFLKRQSISALFGVAAMLVCIYIPIEFYKKMVYVFLVMTLALLVLVFIPGMGISAGGATRWLHFGPVNFQPSELARFALIVYLAYSLSEKSDRIKIFSIGFLPHFLMLSIFSVLILLQPDFGSVIIMGLLTWTMMFVGGVPIKYLVYSLLSVSPFIVMFISKADYRILRIMSFIDPWKYATHGGYQIVHSLMAFGSGGIWGAGIGRGYQKLFYLPEPHTDFIFSVVGEELGLFGVLVILAFYSIIVHKGVQISLTAQDKFASFLALGLTVAFALQVVINMGVTLGLMPTKGLTLPFLSYGGTSLMLNMATMGILMKIQSSESKMTYRKRMGLR